MSVYHDVIGQLPILKTYNHGILGFSISNAVSRAKVVMALQSATDILTASFPWLAGAVINEGSGPGNSGVFKLVAWPSSAQSPNGILRVKNYTDILPSLPELIQKKAPCSMLDGKLLAPYPGFPTSYQDSLEDPAPIIVIQANFVRGGLLLNLSAQHNVIDASGMMQVIQLFSIAMREEKYSWSIINQGNQDRSRVIPLIAPGEPIRDYSHLQRPLGFPPPLPASPDKIPKWAYFLMEESAVPEIKSQASQPEGQDPSVPFISSNDALSAFYWKCIAEVRASNGRSPNAISKFLRAIDARKAMGISHEYMGHMVHHTATRMTLDELQRAPISTIACKLRADLNNVNNEFSVRSYATYIANTPDKSIIMYGGLFNPDTDIGASAVPNADYFQSFGILGVPEFARRPNLSPIPGCIYFMAREGDYLPILVCLRDDDLEGLKKHSEWCKYTEFIG